MHEDPEHKGLCLAPPPVEHHEEEHGEEGAHLLAMRGVSADGVYTNDLVQMNDGGEDHDPPPSPAAMAIKELTVFELLRWGHLATFCF